MKHKHVAFGVVGVLIGFVLGFFSNRALQSPPPAALVAQPQATSELPEGHPPIGQIQQLQALEEHAREHPDSADVKVQLGNAYYDMRQFDLAIRWYEEALKIEPDNVDVNNDLATSYFATGALDRALELLDRSLQMEADNPVALQNLGWIHFVNKDYQAAIDAWSRLVSAHPDYERLEEVKERLQQAESHLKGEHS